MIIGILLWIKISTHHPNIPTYPKPWLSWTDPWTRGRPVIWTYLPSPRDSPCRWEISREMKGSRYRRGNEVHAIWKIHGKCCSNGKILYNSHLFLNINGIIITIEIAIYFGDFPTSHVSLAKVTQDEDNLRCSENYMALTCFVQWIP